ncbi:MAG: DUF4936 family protein [Burkholderiales bacterium]|nr:DUF4936 family protein [Burkholderiales bacterium]MDP2398782.1 DUF4936 family protein [Burkholderiales bacterium]
MTWSYYIYYRVEALHTAACGEAVRKLMDAMHARTGIRGRLLKKRNEPLLWMEIYEGVVDEAKFEWELAESVAAAGIPPLLQQGSSRHIECFAE